MSKDMRQYAELFFNMSVDYLEGNRSDESFLWLMNLAVQKCARVNNIELAVTSTNTARDEIFAYIDDWEDGLAIGTEEWGAVRRCSKMLRQKLSPVA